MTEYRLRDMIVPLLALPEPMPVLSRVARNGITIGRGRGGDMRSLRTFAEEHFSASWADAACLALGRLPATVFVAKHGDSVVGFAVHSGNHPGVFGPTGVEEAYRGSGIGAALLFHCLLDLKAADFLYAIIGGVGPAEFYEKACGAMLLPAEWPNAFGN